MTGHKRITRVAKLRDGSTRESVVHLYATRAEVAAFTKSMAYFFPVIEDDETDVTFEIVESAAW